MAAALLVGMAGRAAALSVPAFSITPQNTSVVEGISANFFTQVTGDPTPTLQWERLPAAGGGWITLTDDATFSGATTDTLFVVPTLAMNGDQFRLTATNSAGTITCTERTLGVQPASPPKITGQPVDATIAPGGYGGFSVSLAYNPYPPTYRWQHQVPGSTEWTDITPGGGYIDPTIYSIEIQPASLAMDGERFRVIVSNPLGSVTSEPATLRVVPPVILPPGLEPLPTHQWVSQDGLLRIDAVYSGTWPIAFQWYRNGVPLAGETSQTYYHWGVGPGYSGDYSVVATNSAGAATSTTVKVVVATPLAPLFLRTPTDSEVYAGQNATPGFSFQAVGSAPITYTWRRNGVALDTGGNYYPTSLQSASSADAAEYTITAANAEGSVTSPPFTLTILPKLPPEFTSWYPQATVSRTRSLYLSATIGGGPGVTLQWFKDGQPLPSAVSNTYSQSGLVSPATAGTYWLEVTSQGVKYNSPDIAVDWLAGPDKPWLDAVRLGDVVYIVLTSPARILRYDLAQAAWLPVVNLPEAKVPTAMLPTPEGVFIAYNKELVRRPLNLSGEVPVATSTTTINVLFAARDFIYFRDGEGIRSRSRQSLAAGPTSYPGQSDVSELTSKSRPAYAAATQSLVITPQNGSTPRIYRYTVVPNGVIVGTPFDDGQLGYPSGKRQLMFPDGARMLNDEGAIHSVPGLRYQGALGAPIDDADFLDDGGIVALRGSKLTLYRGDGWAEAGRFKMAADGYAVFHHGDSLFVFGALASGSPTVTPVKLSALAPRSVLPAGSPLNKRITAEEVFLDANKVLNVVSRSEVGIVRWDTTSRRFLPTVPLPSRPQAISYSPTLGRLVLAYSDGAMSDLFFPGAQPTEQFFSSFPSRNSLTGLLAMDDLVRVTINNAYDSGRSELILADSGEPLFSSSTTGYQRPVTWMSESRRTYGYSFFPKSRLISQTILADGTMQAPVDGPLAAENGNRLWVPMGSGRVLSAFGLVYDADLQPLGSLPGPVADGAFLGQTLYTIRVRPDGTQVQRWAAGTFTADGQVMLPGQPVRVLQVDSNTLLVVTSTDGFLGFHLVNAALGIEASVRNDPRIAPDRPAFFNAEAYLANNPDVAAVIGNPSDRVQKAWAHYYMYGLAENRTDGDFNVQAYLAQYPLLAAQFGTDLKAAALHWYTEGRAQGLRVPVGFDVDGYFARNSDIAGLFTNDRYGAWLHYYNYGLFEGRSFDANFIPAEYLELNQDLKTVFGSNLQAAVMHWFNYGHPIEDRMGRVPIGFNVDSYLARYPDLAAVFAGITPTAVRNVTVWHHYLAYGTLEGRSDGDFEAYHYLATNPDLAGIFGSDIQAAALHWYFYGRREGRRIPGGFTVQNYRSLYPDVVLVFGDDLYGSWLHYRDNGVFEGRVYDDLFRPADYLNLNPDVAAAIGTNYRDALLHWLYYGQYEGRQGRN